MTANELMSAIQTIRTSKLYLLVVIASLLLSYLAVSIQEKHLLCAASGNDCACLPDTCPIRLTSSLLIFGALIYFYTLAENTLLTPAADCEIARQNRLNYLASLLTLLAGVIRIYTTIESCRAEN